MLNTSRAKLSMKNQFQEIGYCVCRDKLNYTAILMKQVSYRRKFLAFHDRETAIISGYSESS